MQSIVNWGVSKVQIYRIGGVRASVVRLDRAVVRTSTVTGSHGAIYLLRYIFLSTTVFLGHPIEIVNHPKSRYEASRLRFSFKNLRRRANVQ